MQKKILQIQSVIKIKDNAHFLFFENYVISVINLSYNNQFHFYNIRNFKIEFTLKPKNKDIFLNNYENFKLFYAKSKDLYLIAYKPNLGIFKLKIKERKIEEIAFFNCNIFFEDLKNNKLYINSINSIIIYDILTKDSSIQKNSKEINENYEQILLIDNYIFIFSLQQVCRWTWIFYCTILDKNMDKLCKKSIFSDIYFGLEDLPYHNSFIPISDNYFLINSQIKENSTLINIVEISIKGKENLIKLSEKSGKKFEDIGVFKRHKIEIKEVGEISLYQFNNDKFGINIGNRNIYEYKISGMELITVYKLISYDIIEKLFLINIKEENKKLKLYLGNKNKMFVLSS